MGLIFEDLRRTGVMKSITIMPIWGGFALGLSLSGDSKPANFLEVGYQRSPICFFPFLFPIYLITIVRLSV